jgi:prepilin signal peptidase PulO-like enzyme (type II secretory pathway)
MAAIGILARLGYSVSAGEPSFLLIPLAISSAFLAFGFLMYRAGQWGGADAKLLAALGILLPYENLFPLIFLINLFLLGAVYMIAYAFIMSILNPKISSEFLRDLHGNLKSISTVVLVFCIMMVVPILKFGTEIMLYTPLVWLCGSGIALIFLWRWLRIVERVGFRKRIRTKDLRVGDMLGQDIEQLGLKSKLIRGLEEDEVRKIRKAVRWVWIREGVRFCPAFLIAIIVSLYFGVPFFPIP